jgi:hypothetical protein
LADDIQSASEVSTPTSGVVHVLFAEDLESGSEVSAPPLAQVHVLSAQAIKANSQLTTPSTNGLSQLFADSIESGSEVTQPFVRQRPSNSLPWYGREAVELIRDPVGADLLQEPVDSVKLQAANALVATRINGAEN